MKKLLFLGAGFLQKFVIERARELGYYVIAADKNPDSVAFSSADESAPVDIVDPEACLAFARQKKIDGVMTAATDYGVLAAAHVAHALGLPGIDPAVAAVIKNKYRVRKALSAGRVDCVRQFYELSCEADALALEGQLHFPLMVKPCDGSGSKAAGRVDSFSEFVAAVREAIAVSLLGRAVAEDFIEGSEYGAESLVVDGQVHVLSVMQKDMTAPPCYAELGHTVPCGLPFEGRVRQTVSAALKTLGVNFGAVNMDMIITPDGRVCIVDIGARMGGNLIGSHIIPLGTGIPYMDNLIRATMGDPVDLRPASAPRPVATRLLALTPGQVVSLPDIALFERDRQVRVYHHLTPGDIIRPYRNNLDGCGYIVATADTPQEAKQRACDALAAFDAAIERK